MANISSSIQLKNLNLILKKYVNYSMVWLLLLRIGKKLQQDVEQYGLYHAYRLAIAPTQSISYVQNATSSVMPIVDQIERRTYGNAETFYPMPFLSPQAMWYYKSAFNTDQMKLIDLIATIQTHIDQGISTILYVNSEISTRELARLYVYAHYKGLKSLYYTRNKLLSVR